MRGYTLCKEQRSLNWYKPCTGIHNIIIVEWSKNQMNLQFFEMLFDVIFQFLLSMRNPVISWIFFLTMVGKCQYNSYANINARYESVTLKLLYLHSGIIQCNWLTVDTVSMICMMTIQFSFHITLIIIQYNFIFINAITMRAVMHNVRSSIVFRMMSTLLSANELLSRLGYQTGCHNILAFINWCCFIFIVRTVFFQLIAITTFTLQITLT